MDMNGLNSKVKELIRDEIGEISEKAESLIGEISASDKSSLQSDIELLRSYLKTIKRNSALNGEENIFRTIGIIGNIESEIDIIIDIINDSTSALSTACVRFIHTIKSKIKTISKRLWQLLAQIMTPREWSVYGDANLNVFGLSGGVTLQLTFSQTNP
jgi:hypothetical protein